MPADVRQEAKDSVSQPKRSFGRATAAVEGSEGRRGGSTAAEGRGPARTLILDAAEWLFGEYGISSVSNRQIGAVVVMNKRIVATGYNGAPAGIPSCKEKGECMRRRLGIPSGQQGQLCYAIHAEQNAIIQAARMGIAIDIVIKAIRVALKAGSPSLEPGHFATAYKIFTGCPDSANPFVAFATAWSIAYVGILYAVALRTANPTVTGQAFLLYFPFVFLSTTVVPREAMKGWLSGVAGFNPLTYVYAALRSLITEGWSASELLKGLLAIVIVGVCTHALAYAALRGRVSRSRH